MQAIRFFNSYIRTLRKLRPHLQAGKKLVIAVLVTSLVAGFFESTAIFMFLPLLHLILSISPVSGQGTAADPPAAGVELPEEEKIRIITFFQDIFPDASNQVMVLLMSGLLLLSIFFKNLMILASSRFGAALRRRVTINLRSSLYRRFHGAELQLFEENETGDLVSVFLQETFRAVMAIDFAITIIQRSCIVLFYLLLMFLLSWQLTLFTMVLAVLIGVGVGSIYKLTKKYGEAFVEANMKLNAHAIESFSGVRQIRTTNNLSRTYRDFQQTNHEQASVDEKQVRAVALLPAIVETMGVLGGIAIITFASIYLLPQKILSPEALFTFGMYLVRMLPIVSLVYSIRGQLIFMAEGLFEVERWLETPQHPAVPFGNRKFEFLKSYLSFEGITYSYPNGKLAVENVTFDVRKGQTVALVGSSGSGKTTLANLLLRMRTPASGAIIVDGISHWEFTPESWHRRVATVEQDAFLFHTTLKENICFGLEDVPDEKVWEVLEMSQLSEWVQTLPDGLNTIVGERGASLSGGQRQRLAIARALVRDPEILVLDEATSALDSVSERLVQEALDNAQKGRTVLVIAHRLSTIRHADKIIVLEQGRIVEKGSWNELQDLGGAFANYVHSSQAY